MPNIGGVLGRIKRVLNQNLYAIRTGYNVIGTQLGLPIFFGGIGISFQVLAITLLFTVLKDNNLLNRANELLASVGLDLGAINLHEATLWIAIVTFILLGTSALGNFLYHKYTIKLSSLVEKQLITKLVNLCNSTELFITPKIKGISYKNSVIRCILADSRGINRVLQVAITTVIPMLTLILSTAFVFYLNWKISVFILPIIVFYSIGIFKVNAAGIKGSHFFDIESSTTRKKVSDSLYLNTEDKKLTEEEVTSYVNAYYELLIISHRSSFVNDITIAVVLSLIYYGITKNTSSLDNSYLTETAAYLIALRYAINYLKQFTTKFSIMNRFYPQTTRLKLFIDFLESKKHPYNKDPKKISLHDNELKTGKAYLIKNDFPVDKFSALSIVNELTQKKSLPLYRNIAVMTRETFLSNNENDDSNKYKTTFFAKADEDTTNWIITDQWSLNKQGLKIEDIEDKYPNKFILLGSSATQEDLNRKREILTFKDDKFESITPISNSDILKTDAIDKDSSQPNDLLTDEF